jgi:hypothetical protein
MSPELETLDQLLGGRLSLSIVRKLYPDEKAFQAGILGLLDAGDVRLLAGDGSEVAPWHQKELFATGNIVHERPTLTLEITQQGICKLS